MIACRLFRPDRAPAEVGEADWPQADEAEPCLLWVDLEAPGDDELDRLAARFALPPAVTVLARRQERRPTIRTEGESYGLTVIAAELEDVGDAPHLHLVELDLLVSRNVLVSVHREALPFREALEERLGSSVQFGGVDAAYLLHVFLDALLDHFARVFDGLERQVERLEDRLLRESGRRALQDVLILKRRVQSLRHLFAAHDELFTTLIAPDSPLRRRPEVDLSMFQTLNARHDRLVLRMDRIRDLLVGSYDLYLTNVGYRTSEQLKVLTFLSAVLLPISAVASVFGMNFQVRAFTDEQLGWLFYGALAGMGLITLGLLAYFRVKRWL